MNLKAWSFQGSEIYSMVSKDQKENIICTKDECGETFYGRHTAQHPAALIPNNDKSLDPLRAKKTFVRKTFGHTAVSAIQASSLIFWIWQKEPKEKYPLQNSKAVGVKASQMEGGFSDSPMLQQAIKFTGAYIFSYFSSKT